MAAQRVEVVNEYKIRRGPVRRFALTVGVLFVVLALLENVLGSLQIGGATLLLHATWLNALHWVTGLALLACAFATERVCMAAARVFGVVYALMTVAGLLFRGAVGTYAGFGAPLPWTYTILHAIMAVAALMAGFRSYEVHRVRSRRHAA